MSDTSTSESCNATPINHPEYYLPSGDIVIQVENTLFRVTLATLHSISPVLQLIVPPTYAGQTRLHGFDDVSPFRLRGVSAHDFAHLLRVLIPLPSTPTPPLATVDDWLSLLKLASQYEISSIRPVAAKYLHDLPIDPIRKIAIWDAFKLDPTLLRSAYVALCMRSKPLTLAMTMSLGLKTFTKVAATRDEYHQRVGACTTCKKYTTKQKKLAEELVGKVFFGEDPRAKGEIPIHEIH